MLIFFNPKFWGSAVDTSDILGGGSYIKRSKKPKLKIREKIEAYLYDEVEQLKTDPDLTQALIEQIYTYASAEIQQIRQAQIENITQQTIKDLIKIARERLQRQWEEEENLLLLYLAYDD